jgi:ComF family protein
MRRVIQAFKYERRRSLGVRLAAILRTAGASTLQDAACVVPVPLHPWRRFRRGFNQAADLAERLERPVVHALWRMRATAAQAGLTAPQRRRNVRGAFRLSPLLAAQSRRQYLEDSVVVLVDDVRTTGATLGECAAVLTAAGALEVRTLTLARAELDKA